MAYNYGLRYDDGGKIESFTKSIAEASQKAQDAFLKAAGQATQDAVKDSISRSDIDDPRHTHIKDDVQLSFPTDKETGNKIVRIRGSKKTGTLWHIVNDGTWRHPGNHFMDKAMAEVDFRMDSILDATLAFLGE